MEGLECSIPKEELTLARTRLRDASKAQTRQQKARTQLRVRVDAPTTDQFILFAGCPSSTSTSSSLFCMLEEVVYGFAYCVLHYATGGDIQAAGITCPLNFLQCLLAET